MLVRKLRLCSEILAGDGTRLKELLHPSREYKFSGRYSLAHAVLAPGAASRRHVLKSDEVYFIVSGRGVMHIDDESAEVEAGDAIDIPPRSVQSIENSSDGELEFLCIVDPAWESEHEEILAD